MPYFAPRHRYIRARRRSAALISSSSRIAETAAMFDAWCARINPGLGVIVVALALALLAPAILTQSPPSWVITVDALTDVAPSANPQWP